MIGARPLDRDENEMLDAGGCGGADEIEIPVPIHGFWTRCARAGKAVHGGDHGSHAGDRGGHGFEITRVAFGNADSVAGETGRPLQLTREHANREPPSVQKSDDLRPQHARSARDENHLSLDDRGLKAASKVRLLKCPRQAV
jgi:hypothetical protein